MWLDYVYISFILLSVLCGLFFIKKTSHISYSIFLAFLIITVMNETLCFYIKESRAGSTYPLYNVYYYIRFPILGLVYFHVYTSSIQKRIVILFWVASVLFLAVNLFYYSGLNKLHSNYLFFGGLFVILLCLFHFYNILKMAGKRNPLRTNFFWISTGFFFFFLGMLPFYGIINLLLKNNMIFVSEYLATIKTLSILLYSLISVDFYLNWKHQK